MKNNNLTLFLAIVIIGIIGSGILYIMRSQNKQTTELSGSSVKLEKQINDEDRVTVEIQPQKTAEGLEFDISLATHAGDLNEELDKTATLTDENGIKYQPTSWQGDSPGGHHRKGKLIFDNIPYIIKIIQLNLGTIAGSERRFEWKL